MAHALSLPGSDDTWNLPLAVPPTRSAWGAVMTEVRWLAAFTVPWMYRHARGRSSGDGRTAKRPHLTPVTQPGSTPDRA
jgi:hypothetical protein